MPRFKNVTVQEIRTAKAAGEKVISMLSDLTYRIQKGYCDPLQSPADLARHFNSLSRLSSEMVSHLLVNLAVEEIKTETENLLRKSKSTLEKPNVFF